MENCEHHWMIEPQRGPISRGECRKCGAVKDFANSFTATSLAERKAETACGL